MFEFKFGNQRFPWLQEFEGTMCLNCQSFLHTRGFGGWEVVLFLGVLFSGGGGVGKKLLAPVASEITSQPTYLLLRMIKHIEMNDITQL